MIAQKQEALTLNEWQALAELASVVGREAAEADIDAAPERARSQRFIVTRARRALQQSALLSQQSERDDLRNVWQHNYYQGWRNAESGGCNGEVYPGSEKQTGYVDGDDYISREESEAHHGTVG